MTPPLKSAPSPASRRRARLIRGYLRTARAGGIAIILFGLLVLTGCIWRIEPLTRLFPGMPEGTASISTGVLLLGVALLLAQGQRRKLEIAARLTALAAFFVGLIPEALSVFKLEPPAALLLYQAPAKATEYFFLATAALCLFTVNRRSPSGRRPAQWLAMVLILGAIWTLLRYIYIPPDLSLLEHFSPIPMTSALCFLIFGICFLLTRPEDGVMAIFCSSSVAGQMARSILPVGILMLAALGVATIIGLRTGLYDSGLHNVIFTLCSIVIVTVLVWRNAQATDLTEQEREAAVDAVERQREWQQVMLSSIADAVIATDQTGRVQFLNPVAEKLTGFPGSEAVGMPSCEVYQLLDIATGQALPGPVEEVLQSGEPAGQTNVAMLLTRHGSRIPVEDRAAPIRDARLGIVGSVVVFRDVTERRRAEEMREEVARQYATVSEAIPQIVWTSRSDGEVDFFNQRWFDYTGLDLEQSRGRLWLNAFHDSDQPRAAVQWQESIGSGRRFEVEARIERRDGASRWHLIRALPVRDRAGHIDKWFGTCTDIDDQKRAEETMRFLADASTILSASLDEINTLQNVAELAVPKIADLCTVHLAQEGTLQLAAVSHMDPRKVEMMVEIDRRFPHSRRQAKGIDNVIRTGLSELSPEIDALLLKAMSLNDEHEQMLRELGVHSTMSVPLNGHGRILGVITFSSLESGRRFSARDLTLAEEVARRTALALDNNRLLAEITETKEEAENANAAKDQFLAVLSHELRTPLTPVLLAVEELRQEKDLPANVVPVLEMTQRNIELEARLIDDLLDLTRIQRGKLQLQKTLTDSHALLQSAIDICRADIDSKNLCIALDLAATSRHIDADPARLQQIFWNLIKNAVKFTPAGGTISFRSRNHRTRLEIDVADTGIGVNPNALEKIFNAFEQGDPNRTRLFGGLGLGLAITRNLVEAHGGSIAAQSEGENKGTTFTIVFPTVEVPAGLQSHPAPKAVAPESAIPLRILLVEDNPDTGALLKKILMRRGYRVDHAATMNAALKLAEADSSYDLLLSDIGLPDGGGLELIRTLRERGITMPGIAMSGFGMDEDVRRSREAGFSEHLTKPISINTLVETIHQLRSALPA